MPKKVFISFLFSFLFTGAFSQSVRFRHLATDEGLSQNAVYSIVQDSLGFMWMATADGLNRYDGINFKVYRAQVSDTNGLSGNNIKCLFTKGHYLWIGTYGSGMNRMDLTTGKIKRYAHDPKNINSLFSDNVNCIKEIDGLFYIGTVGGGVGTFDPKTETFKKLEQIPATSVRDLCSDNAGHIWFATNKGAYDWNTHSNIVEAYHNDGTKKNINTERVRTIFVDSRGWVWLSLWEGGCNMIDPSSGTVYNNRSADNFIGKILNYGLVSNFLEDSKGNLWMVTAENGAVMYDPKNGTKRVFMNDANDVNSLSDNTAFSIFEDRSHILWIGTWRGGVNIYDPKTLHFGWYKKDAKDSTSLSNDYVYSLTTSHDGKIWIGTAEGACSFDPKTKKFTKFFSNQKDDLSLRYNSTVFSLHEDIDSTLWFATSGGGLYHYFPKTKKWMHYNSGGVAPKTLASQSPSVMTVLNDRDLYVGTYDGGLLLYNREKDDFKTFEFDSANINTISGNIVDALETTNDGKIWVGTADGGLNLFDPAKGTFKRFVNDTKDPNSIIDNSVTNLCLDHHNNLWVGTPAGLCMFDQVSKHFVSYTKEHEFLKQEIISLVEDQSGDIWIGTRKGLGRLNTNDNSLRTYEISDGLQSNEFFYKAFARTTDGTIYLGGPRGMNCFSPADIIDNTIPPNAVITDMTVLNKKYSLPTEISFTNSITLKYSDYFFSFHFSALEYSNPKKNAFKYKLEGFNTDWVEIGNTNSVTFTNLDPGEYNLLIEASNSSGVWNQTPTQLKLIITPPFWRTKWFYALCGIVVIASAYSFIKYREKKLVKEKAELEDKVELRTTELRHEKEKVEAAHKDIKDSINYAKRIQDAILPHSDQFASLLPQSFVLFKPKDIVSGDFYWIASADEKVFYVTADCTGHGVPGGFMTMLGTSLLNEIVSELKIHEPSKILDHLREKIIASLRQSAIGESKDGMDMVVCRLDKANNKLVYAGANNSVYVVHDGVIDEFKPDKQPIGFYGEETKPFTQKEIQLQHGDVIYTFTDGYADQFGGEKGKKFKYKQLENLLLSNHAKPMHEQKHILDTAIENWKHGFEQVDDILVIGVKIA